MGGVFSCLWLCDHTQRDPHILHITDISPYTNQEIAGRENRMDVYFIPTLLSLHGLYGLSPIMIWGKYQHAVCF